MLVVHKAAVRAFCADHYSPAHIDAWFHERTPDVYRPALEARRVWVAEAADKILGFASAEPGEVTLLFVDPEHAGRGLGKLLFEGALSRAAERHEGPIVVIATLNSVSFYQRYGFEPIEDGAFVRGDSALRYPVKKTVQRTRSQASHAPVAADA